MNEEERLRKVIEQVLRHHPMWREVSESDLATDLIPAILDEFDDEFEQAWAYRDLCE